MQLPVTRRLRRADRSPAAPWALLAFGAALAAGFLLGEILGGGAPSRAGRALRGLRPGKPDPRAARIAIIKAVLEAEPELAGVAFGLVPAGPAGLELRGWVLSRSARTRAFRLAQAAAGKFGIVNRLLVRGEDDAPAPLHLEDEPRSA